MSVADQTEESPASTAGTIVIPAKLAPTEAAELREGALTTLNDTKDAVTIDVDGDDPSACALQMLIAARRSAEAKGLSISFTDTAETVFGGIEMH